MKKANPVSLRIGINKPWLTTSSSLNSNKTILYQLKIQRWLVFILSFLSLKLRLNFLTCVSLNSSNFYNSLFFFIKGIFFFFKKTRRAHFFRLYKKRKHHFVNRFFLKKFLLYLESFLINSKKIPIHLTFRNLYSAIFFNRFLKFFEIKKRRFARKFKKVKNFFSLFSYMLLSFFYKDSSVLLRVLLLLLSKTKKHRNNIFVISKFLRFFFKFFPKVQSINVKISGRLNGRPRTQDKWLSFGSKLNLQQYSKNISYSYERAITPSGVLGIKVWIQ